MQTLQEWWRAVRRTATPIVVIESHDEIATGKMILKYVREEKGGEEALQAPVWTWACAGGFQAHNVQGEASAPEGIEQVEDALVEIGQSERIPPRSVVVMFWRVEMWGSPMARQALINLREGYKRQGKTCVVVIGYGQQVPEDVAVHVVTYQEALPGVEELAGIVERAHESARRQDSSIALIESHQVAHIVGILRGMSTYQAEQQVYMALRKGIGIDTQVLQESKIGLINQTPGLQVWQGGESFESMAGNEGVKGYFRAVLRGRLPIRLVVWVDESEDMLAGVEGDLSGIAQGYLGRLAGHIEDTKAQCILAYGHPGTGKSLTAKAVASEAGCLCLALDLGTMKGSLVGQSEAQLSRALAMERSIVGGELGSTLWIFTSNNADKLPPKLRSRMQAELFYDSPGEQERLAIWALYRRKYELPLQDMPDDEGWTGREIERCCRLAWQFQVELKESSQFIVPRAIVDAREIEERRKKASGRYLDAGKGGVYKWSRGGEEERSLSL